MSCCISRWPVYSLQVGRKLTFAWQLMLDSSVGDLAVNCLTALPMCHHDRL